MTARFAPDPFSAILDAFNARHPDAGVVVQWVTDLYAEERAWGRTHFDEDPIVIEIDGQIPVAGALDVLAHELAHVAAGFEVGHGPAWQEAKEALVAAVAG